MPLNLPMDNPQQSQANGTLYVTATPIGHMEDITLRALDVLRKVHWVASEDTRQAGLLFAHHGITAQLVSYHEHNETERTPILIERLQSGQDIALICNAGTPTVSDPGYRLIKTAISENIRVVPIPGVSAAITALSVSGFPTDEFAFVGFLPKKQGKRHERLKVLADEERTIILYESPKRILKLLKDIQKVMGDRRGMLSREMTKPHEEFIRGRISDILNRLETRSVVKGECTLLLSGKSESAGAPVEVIREEILSALSETDKRLGDISRAVSKKLNVSRQFVYSEALKLKKGSTD